MAAAEAEGRGGELATPAPAPNGSQSVEDRRLLRSRYLAMKSLISDEKDDMASADSVKFRSIFMQVEDLHKLVQRPREQISDAEALLDIATSLVTSVRSQSALGITPSDFVAGLLKKFGKQGGTDDEGASLSWGGVGLAASHVFMAVPGCCTMVGPMNTEVKPRRVQTSRKRTARPRGSACPEQMDLVRRVDQQLDKESWDLNNAEKIEAAGTKKEEGNALFKLGKYARASKRYEKAAKYIEYDTSFSEDEKKQSKQLKITCNLNNAACKLKLKDYKQAEKLCTKVPISNLSFHLSLLKRDGDPKVALNYKDDVDYTRVEKYLHADMVNLWMP